MVENVGKASATTYSASIDDIDDLSTPEFQIGFYRITQECLSNIPRHAEASEAKVVVRRNGTRLELSVSDNGKGFTYPGGWKAPKPYLRFVSQTQWIVWYGCHSISPERTSRTCYNSFLPFYKA